MRPLVWAVVCLFCVGGSQALPPYSGTITPISSAWQQRMRGTTWFPGCPVSLSQLVVVHTLYYGMDDRAHTGALIVHRRVAPEVVQIFSSLYRIRFPIQSMRPMFEYGGDDTRSMAANNTSAFNCRRIAGSRHWSQHSYGVAIDIDPFLNPYIRGDRVEPAGAVRDAGVSGVIHRGDRAYRSFTDRQWSWGGDWVSIKDYHHFEKRGVLTQ